MILRSVPRESAVADIGTDHAFLPIALRQSGTARRVFACDISEGPLRNAEVNVNKSGVDGIELRLSNGLDALREDEVDVVVIAGMGGDVIAEILSRAPWIKNDKKLILQPMSSADAVHRYLYENGFAITSEKGVFDSGRCYAVICAEYDGVVRTPDAAQLLVGELSAAESGAAREFITRQQRRCRKCADDLKDIERKASDYEFMKAAAEQLEKML